MVIKTKKVIPAPVDFTRVEMTCFLGLNGAARRALWRFSRLPVTGHEVIQIVNSQFAGNLDILVGHGARLVYFMHSMAAVSWPLLQQARASKNTGKARIRLIDFIRKC